MRRAIAVPLGAAACILGLTCTDGPTAPLPAPAANALRAAVTCHASVRDRTVSCAAPLPDSTGANLDLVVGGQGVFVKLVSSNVAYAADRFTFDVTVQNLIGQSLGTPNDTAVTGVDVFFVTDPVVVAGTGTITVEGDGVGVFTASQQPYYHYDELLTSQQSSASKTWTLDVPATATDFSFQVYVNATVPHPAGWVDITAPADTLDLVLAGRQTDTLTETVYDVLGRVVADATPTFSSSAPGIATVDAATGVVTAAGVGATTITATAGVRTGSVSIAVTHPLTVLSLSDSSITADGTSTTTATLSLFDALGQPLGIGGATVAFDVGTILYGNAGGQPSAVVDHGDGSYTATITAPVNNGTSTVTAKENGDSVASTMLTYANGNNIPFAPPFPSCDTVIDNHVGCTLVVDPDLQHITEDSHDNHILLPGSDADGDPLTARITSIYTHDPDATLTKLDGTTPVEVGDIVDQSLLFTPTADDFGPYNLRVGYILSDGKSQSDSGSIAVLVDGVDDPPRPTLAPTLTMFEGDTSHFLMGGHDPEGNIYRVRFTVRPDIRGALNYLADNGFDTVLVTPATTTLENTSDISFGWPMEFIPDPYDNDSTHYNEFSYVLEQVPDGLTGPENTVVIKVLPFNDPPTTTIGGTDSLQNQTLTTTAVQGGNYTFPAITTQDPDVTTDNNLELKVRIETSAGGTLSLDYFDYQDALVPFTISDTSIVFTMPLDVTSRGFRPDLTLDNLLKTLAYTPQTTGPKTLIITVDDQGNSGACSKSDVTNTTGCAKQSVTTINIDVQAGTPPADGTVLTLTPSGG